jgi:TonB family protein
MLVSVTHRSWQRADSMYKSLQCWILLIGILAVGYSAAQEPADPRVHEFTAVYAKYQSLAEQGRFEEALPKAKKALVLGEELFGEDHKNTAALTFNLGDMLLRTDRKYEARPVLTTALMRYEATYGEQSEELIPLLLDLGQANVNSGKPPSKTIFRRALKLVAKYEGRDSNAFAQASLRAGATLEVDGEYQVAKGYLEDAYKIFDSKSGPDHPSTGQAAFFLGKYWNWRNNRPKARDQFLRALAVFENSDDSSRHFRMSTHAFLVDLYERMEQSDKATEHCLAIGRMSPVVPDQEYQPLFRLAPIYPNDAIARRLQGYVDLSFTIDEGGFVRDPTVVESTASTFESAALESVEKWRYAPRFLDNEPVATEGVVTRMTFKFSD